MRKNQTTDTTYSTRMCVVYTLFKYSLSNIQAQNGTTVIQVRKPVQQTPDVQGQELVSWAEKQFGGVSSFTTMNAPKMIEFTGVKGTRKF